MKSRKRSTTPNSDRTPTAFRQTLLPITTKTAFARGKRGESLLELAGPGWRAAVTRLQADLEVAS
jgi:hypothetical protein